MEILVWIAGFFAVSILSMAMAFSAGGAAQTGALSLKIITAISGLLVVYLIWLGVHSLFFSTEGDIKEATPSVIDMTVKEYDSRFVEVADSSAPSQQTTEAAVKENKNYDYILWLFYPITLVLLFMGVRSIKKEVRKKKDESGIQAWDPNARSKEEK